MKIFIKSLSAVIMVSMLGIGASQANEESASVNSGSKTVKNKKCIKVYDVDGELQVSACGTVFEKNYKKLTCQIVYNEDGERYKICTNENDEVVTFESNIDFAS